MDLAAKHGLAVEALSARRWAEDRMEKNGRGRKANVSWESFVGVVRSSPLSAWAASRFPAVRSRREVIEAENTACEGGLRRAARVTSRRHWRVGRRLMAGIMWSLWSLLEAAGQSPATVRHAGCPCAGFTEDLVDKARATVAAAVGMRPGEAKASPGTTIHGNLLERLSSAVADVDPGAARVLRGAGLGVRVPVEPSPAFPPAHEQTQAKHADLSYHFHQPWANYASTEEEPGRLQGLLEDEVRKGYVRRFTSLADVEAFVGSKVVVSKCGLRPKKDAGWRLITDLTECGVNLCALLPNRVVLPRPQDFGDDIVEMVETAGGVLVLGVADFVDAFRKVPLHKLEQALVVLLVDDVYYVFVTLPFGHRGAPLQWCRLAALATRLAQLGWHPGRLRLNTYVDDPAAASWAPTLPEALRQLDCIWLLWAALGFGLKMSKAHVGAALPWCGVYFDSVARLMRIPAEKRAELLDVICAVLGRRSVARRELRSLAGKLQAAAGVLPFVRAWLRGLFTVANEEGGLWIRVGRVALDLRWIYWVLERGRGWPIERPLRFASVEARGVRVGVDASPRGFGGALFTPNGKAYYFIEEVTEGDRAFWYPRPRSLESRHVACLEALALLCAVRLFAPFLRQAALPVALRSDSKAAVGAALHCYTRGDEAMQRVVRELAYEAASQGVDLRIVEHQGREENEVADALSKGTVPKALRGPHATQVRVAPRDGAFWVTRNQPPSTARGV